MKIPIFQVDAFTDKLFHGNPAAICFLEKWLDDHLMQKIAMENNLSETAFVVQKKDHFEIRWFTPLAEVPLCGHATLATAHIIFNHYHYTKNEIVFQSRHSGLLRAQKEEYYLTLDFPAQAIKKAMPPVYVIQGIGEEPIEIYKGKTDYVLVYKNQKQIENISPDFTILSKAKIRGVIVTARGDEVDFVSRFFAPTIGVNEDPVTGSAHTLLIPYWRKNLKKNKMIAKQLSARQGLVQCRMKHDRVYISGKAITYLQGEIINI